MSMDPETRSIIEDVLKNNRVVLFMKGHRHEPQCGFSAKMVGMLDILLSDYLHINVLDHPEIREGIKEYTNWPTIPQLFVNGELVGGADIVGEMFTTGELAELLGVGKPEPGAPRISISESAATVMNEAAAQHEGLAVHLRINASWQHVMALTPPGEQELCARIGAVDLYMDPWTASRADGLVIDMEETLQGRRFRFDNPNSPPPVQQMSAQSLKSRLDSGESLELIDVRSAEERSIASIGAARAWDAETERYLDSLPKDTLIVCHCHKGKRSQQAAEYLRGKGFTNVHSLSGGIDAWAVEIDCELPRY
jgi:monothiol glutaredoxin